MWTVWSRETNKSAIIINEKTRLNCITTAKLNLKTSFIAVCTTDKDLKFSQKMQKLTQTIEVFLGQVFIFSVNKTFKTCIVWACAYLKNRNFGKLA